MSRSTCPFATLERQAAGVSLVELVVIMGVVAVLGGLVAPSIANLVAAARLRQAAGFVATRFRLARAQAAATTVSVGVVFDRVAASWTFRVCEDGNGNGLRRAEIDDGRDVCREGPHDLAALFPGVRILADEGLRGPDGEPGSSDPVRFGPSDLASFSPAGTCTAGSVWLQGSGGRQYLVRVAGVTGRTRVLRYDAAARVWRDG